MDGFQGNTLCDPDGNINTAHPRFAELKSVIDYALQKQMFVVINTHHENWLNSNYDGSALYDQKFAGLWTSIATQFKGYSGRLIFEVLNEPHGVFGDWSGGVNPSNSAALELTRKINLVGYNAIRKTGGANATRLVMVSTNGMGNHSQLDDVYPTKASVPGGGTDPYLAFHVHTYDPWAFCGQTGSNTAWPGSASFVSGIQAVSSHARSLGIPVNYGEFGVGRDTRQEERNTTVVREYYRTMRLTCLSEKIAPTVWDDRGWFGLSTTNASGAGFVYNIVPSMMAQ
jgi:endoglucanase